MSQDSVFESFDHWWNVAMTQGPSGSLRDICKAAFECGVLTGQARPAMVVPSHQDGPVPLDVLDNCFIRGTPQEGGEHV